MASHSSQLQKVQLTLKQMAEDLGTINLTLNKFLQQNDKLSHEVQQLKHKAAKKKHIIEQQNKDKMIIHAKLVQAQKKKTAYEIGLSRKQRNHQSQNKIIQQNNAPKPIVQSKFNKTQQLKKVQMKKAELQQQQKQEKKESPIQTDYQNQDKGGYQPPLLFANTNNQDQNQNDDQDEEDDQDMLQKIRNNFQTDGADEEKDQD